MSKVLVTGGGSGIGLAITEALLAEGCQVVICGRNMEKLESARQRLNSDGLFTMQWDVRDVSIIKEKINEAACLCGGYLDGFVNNAGIYYPRKSWGKWDEAEDSETWDAVMETNFKAPVFMMREAAMYMNANHIRGNVLNIASMVATFDTNSAYSAGKLALVRMMRGLAKQVGHLGIIINGISPGIVFSEINPKRAEIPQAQIGRMIEPEEIADIALFLMSDAAKLIMGDSLLADGGFSHAHW
ncbi:SDR family oxidoreductase [Oscillospiraceae bacterium OttesenSCG-928-F05]|nr:SDR family oxidoreductase [Oscillospiraceae bacterium OttesenSCG-928-F05]